MKEDCVEKLAKKERPKNQNLKDKERAEIKIKPDFQNICCNICENDHYITIEDWNRIH